MVAKDYSDFFLIKESSWRPKYIQLSEAIVTAVEKGRLKRGVTLPSINELSAKLEVSRDTAEKSYKHLKDIGFIESVPGKGYYVQDRGYVRKLSVLLLLNKLSAHKKTVYDEFVNVLGNDIPIDLFIYSNDILLFERFLSNAHSDYSHYVIAPHFDCGEERAAAMINDLPSDKLILMDRQMKGIQGNVSMVRQDFENNIYQALKEALPDLKKYHMLKIITPDGRYFPKEILAGFRRFCQYHQYPNMEVRDIQTAQINPGDVFIDLVEEDLVTLLSRVIDQGYQIGKDVGVISYNETALKRVTLGGISTISTDFVFMGRVAAEMVINRASGHVEIPFIYTKRSSL